MQTRLGTDQAQRRYFTTMDLYFAAYLLSAGCVLLPISKERRASNGKMEFVFEFTAGIFDLQMDYFNRKATIEPIVFVQSIRNLKAFVHNPEQGIDFNTLAQRPTSDAR